MALYYHYTSSENLEKIKDCGCIFPSPDVTKDSRFGRAVYFTTLKPLWHSKLEIAKNNYNSGYRRRISEGKLDCYIEIEIEYGEPNPFIKCPAQGREVFKVNGQLWLRNFKWNSGRISEFCEWGQEPAVDHVVKGCQVCGITFSDYNGNYGNVENMMEMHMMQEHGGWDYAPYPGEVEIGCRDPNPYPGVVEIGCRDPDPYLGVVEIGCRDPDPYPGVVEIGCRDPAPYPGVVEIGCKVCGKTFSDYNGNYKRVENMRKMHMKAHEPKNIPCPIARDKFFKNPASALKHVESGACESCRGSEKARKAIFEFVKSKKVAQHLMNPQLEYEGGRGRGEMPEYPYRCNQCRKEFKNISSLMQHQTDSQRCNDESSRLGKMALC